MLCSDGVLEFMSNADIIATVHMLAQRGHKPDDIAKFVVCSSPPLPSPSAPSEAPPQ